MGHSLFERRFDGAGLDTLTPVGAARRRTAGACERNRASDQSNRLEFHGASPFLARSGWIRHSEFRPEPPADSR